ncbi:MAG TPA: hypothetical protein DEO70_11365 [Bacteroidales bacterium]|nr:MAG: hypothetical protein A2X11_05405 [Bacteroidetes bacterium GWE2_42_24]OFY26548.1 MAG: hypothetical protein A2X09_03160 [Bacteroidetes bacterium GWF2_43_11]HBZ67425.1 hypothetical protein [Bacteroidales bacterium]
MIQVLHKRKINIIVMEIEEKVCSKCVLSDEIEGVIIGDDGICNYCKNFKPFVPYGESKLLKILEKAKRKNRLYDALVPLSGGKDSTYVLYLAVKKYKLNVLTYTYDNGFVSDFARKNIDSSIRKCNVDHIWVKHDEKLIEELYRTALMQSGEICGVCGVGIERSMLKISEAWKTPVILLGHSATEENSFTSENIYDQNRLKAIFGANGNISQQFIKRFLVYPDLDFIRSYLFTKTGRFGKKVNILYYLDVPSDKEIGEILKNEMNWIEPDLSKYTRHFDCIAEPFTNYVREKRLNSSRRLPQLCNMIRNNEMTREEAFQICINDKESLRLDNFDPIMKRLNLAEKDIQKITSIPFNVYGNKTSMSNKIFAIARSILKENAH